MFWLFDTQFTIALEPLDSIKGLLVLLLSSNPIGYSLIELNNVVYILAHV